MSEMFIYNESQKSGLFVLCVKMCVSVCVCVCVCEVVEHFWNFPAHRSHAQATAPWRSPLFASFDSSTSITLHSSKCQRLLEAEETPERLCRAANTVVYVVYICITGALCNFIIIIIIVKSKILIFFSTKSFIYLFLFNIVLKMHYRATRAHDRRNSTLQKKETVVFTVK